MPMPDPETWGERLKRLREARGMSGADLVEFADVLR